MIKNIIKKILSKNLKDKLIRIKNNYFDGYSTKSYSQEGEDLILKRFFGNQKKGFYIDVGAHHPKRFSNTYFFYKKGWRGINIDAMPNSMQLFNKTRPRDINIEKPISNKQEVLEYYAFKEPALNTFSKQLVKTYEQNGHQVLFTRQIEPTTLDAILNRYIMDVQEIDFLTVDVEGLDLSVLKSISLDKFKPKVILIEILEIAFFGLEENEITQYLKQYNYVIFAKSVNTVFFINNEFLKKNLIEK